MQTVTTRRILCRPGIHGAQGVASSNLVAPTNSISNLRTPPPSGAFVWGAHAATEFVGSAGVPLALAIVQRVVQIELLRCREPHIDQGLAILRE
jgi:hypothetical protein